VGRDRTGLRIVNSSIFFNSLDLACLLEVSQESLEDQLQRALGDGVGKLGVGFFLSESLLSPLGVFKEHLFNLSISLEVL